MLTVCMQPPRPPDLATVRTIQFGDLFVDEHTGWAHCCDHTCDLQMPTEGDLFVCPLTQRVHGRVHEGGEAPADADDGSAAAAAGAMQAADAGNTSTDVGTGACGSDGGGACAVQRRRRVQTLQQRQQQVAEEATEQDAPLGLGVLW